GGSGGEQICGNLGPGGASADYQHAGSAELVAGAVIGGVQLCPGELCGPGDEGHEGATPCPGGVNDDTAGPGAVICVREISAFRAVLHGQHPGRSVDRQVCTLLVGLAVVSQVAA